MEKKLRKFIFHDQWHAWTDINAESRPHASTEIYVPRDEALEKRKRDAFNLGKLKGILRNIIPSLTVTDSDYLKGFSDLNSIYKGRSQEGGDQKKRSFQNIVSRVQDSVEEFFKFDPPHIISSKHHFINNCVVFEPSPLTGSFGHLRALTTIDSCKLGLVSGDTSCWLRDDELSRQALAGINPLSIEKIKVINLLISTSKSKR
jgi:lipoxygenase